jgi:hypothetical protein
MKDKLENITISLDAIDDDEFSSLMKLQNADYYLAMPNSLQKELPELTKKNLLNLDSVKLLYRLISLNKYEEMDESVLKEISMNRVTALLGRNEINEKEESYFKVTIKNIKPNDIKTYFEKNKTLLKQLISEDLKRIPTHQKLAYHHLLSGSLYKSENHILYLKDASFYKTFKNSMNQILNELESENHLLLTDSTHISLQLLLDNLFYSSINEKQDNVAQEIVKDKKLIDYIISQKENFETQEDKSNYVSFFLNQFINKLKVRYEIKNKYYNKEEVEVLENITLYFLKQLSTDKNIIPLSLKNDTFLNTITDIHFSNNQSLHNKIKDTLLDLVDKKEVLNIDDMKSIFKKIHQKAKAIDDLKNKNDDGKYGDIFLVLLTIATNLSQNTDKETIDYFFDQFPLNLGKDLCQMVMVKNKNLSDDILNEICVNSLTTKENMLDSGLEKHVHQAIKVLGKNKKYTEKNAPEISKNFFTMIDFLSEQNISLLLNNEKRMGIFELFNKTFAKEITQGYYKKYSALTYLIEKSKANIGLVPYAVNFIESFPELINQKDKNDRSALEYISSKNTDLVAIKNLLIENGAQPKLTAFEKLMQLFHNMFKREKNNEYEYNGVIKNQDDEKINDEYETIVSDFIEKVDGHLDGKEIEIFKNKIQSIVDLLSNILPKMEEKENFITDENYLFFKSLKDTYLISFTQDFIEAILQTQNINEEEKSKSQEVLKKQFTEQLDLIEEKMNQNYALYSSIVAEKNIGSIEKNTLFLKSKM